VDEPIKPTNRTGGLLVWCSALVLQAAALLMAWRFYTDGQLPVAALALGLIVASALVFVLPWVFARQWHAPRSTVYGLAAALCLCMPGVGIVCCLLSLLCAQVLMRQKNKTREFLESLEMAIGDDSGWITRKRVGQVLADEIAIEPVVDVLQGDDPDLKRGAVKLLQRIGTKGAVGLLRQSLSDQFPEVRFYAHSALTELEDGYTKRIQDIEKMLTQKPSAASYRLLGQQYRAYADSGLADEIARGQHLENSRDAFLKALELEPGHPQTMLLLAQVMLDLNQLRQAWQLFEKCTVHDETVSEAQLGLAQIAFQMRDFKQLARQARSMADSVAARPEKADALELFEFWAGVGKVGHG